MYMWNLGSDLDMPGWKDVLAEEWDKPYFKQLQSFLDEEYTSQIIYPARSEIGSAFKITAYENVKVVILGQDPYHGEGQAHGMSFSVKPGVRIPPS